MPYWLACSTAGATLILLFIGGLVTTHRAALAVPDWPTTFGTNMFFFPWSRMVGGVFYEHTHRLVASGVGMLTVALALALWWIEKRVWLRWLGAAALILVVAQGVVGGLRVVLLEETLAMIHASLAQFFFALVVALACLTSPEWSGEIQKLQLPDTLRVRRLALLTTVLIYFQAVAGAVVRHTGAGLDVHLFLAALVALHTVLLGHRILRSPSGPAKIKRLAVLLMGLLSVQLALGLGAYWVRFVAAEESARIILTTSHVVIGAALLGCSVALTLSSFRLLAMPELAPHEGVSARRVSV